MKRLILIAGPPCAGKTKLIDSIFSENPYLLELLEISSLEEWKSLNAWQLDNIDFLKINNLILHYDLVQQYEIEIGYRFLAELFNNNEHIIFVTLVASPFSLLFRNTKRLLVSLFALIFSLSGRIRNKYRKLSIQWKREKLYLTRETTKSIYQHWLEYTGNFKNTRHFLFDISGIPSTSGQSPYFKNLKTLHQNPVVR